MLIKPDRTLWNSIPGGVSEDINPPGKAWRGLLFKRDASIAQTYY
jgi:hypothetical protein